MRVSMTSIRSIPRTIAVLSTLAALLFGVSFAAGQKTKSRKAKPSVQSAKTPSANDAISGMYTFLREGEFVQITVEEGKLSGFVSRYGERDSDRDAFLDQFFNKGSIEGNNISFTTKPVHGTWYEFSGEVSRGEAKTPDKEGYWIIRGTLKQYDENESKQVAAKSREVTFKSFPQEQETDEPK